ncbi:hypothetical protein [Streptomyces halobius]|uniref:Uncharacterized protein n=1 Tax=Streptomyces halobius TaxID=2879846 RepID=A0ABY4M9L2_9ACTN|nr:hypothetical protein [Streptomyces halobius]UQA94474.1 hypothetical protein K9S39_23755 [Streptomyces halobius]
MTNKENWLNSLKGGGFIKGSAAGLGEMLGNMFLGWRSLLLGCCGTVAGFVGAVTNSGLTTRITLLAIGSASLALTWVTLKYMKRQQNERNDPQR